jgi:hypothetical protein
MPSKKKRLPVYLTQEEYGQIAASAARAGISLSTFAKRVCTGMAVPSLEHKQAVSPHTAMFPLRCEHMPAPTPCAGRKREARREPPLPTPRRAWRLAIVLRIQ